MTVRAAAVLLCVGSAIAARDARADASGEFYRATDLERDGKDAEAAAAFRALVQAAPADPFADDALFELARLEEEKLGDPAGALRDYQRLARDYPDSRLAVRAARRVDELAKTLGPEGQPGAAAAAAEWGRIFYGFAGRTRAETIRLVEDFLARNPGFPDAAHAETWLATLLRDEGRIPDALARLRSVAAKADAGEWRQHAQRAEAEILVGTGDLDGAEVAYRAADDDDGLRRVDAERWRWRLLIMSWTAVVAAALAGVASVRKSAGSFRPLLRAPAELRFLFPVAVLFAAAGLTENAVLGHALEIICVGGLAAAWLSGAALDAARARGVVTWRRAVAHATVAATAVVSVCYIAVTRERLVDQLVETIRFGADK